MTGGRRVFKLKTFDRWAQRILSDAQLCQAAEEVLAGRFDADLGGGVCKKRIAAAGRGKSGSTRVLIARQHEGSIFFLAGRQNSDPGTDFSDKQVAVAKIIASGVHAARAAKLLAMLEDGTIKEICR